MVNYPKARYIKHVNGSAMIPIVHPGNRPAQGVGLYMAYTMLKFPDDPIAVVRVVLPLEHTLGAARHIWNELNREADQCSEPFYTVLDLSAEQPDFSDILLWIDERRTVPTSRYRSPNMRTVLVGSHVMVSLAVRKFQRQLDVEITHCDTLDEALVRIHSEIAACRASTHIA